MIIDTSKLSDEGKRFVGEEPQGVLDLGADSDVRPVGPIKYDLFLSVVGDNLIAAGSLSVDCEFACIRCAEMFPLTVSEPRFQAVVGVLNKSESVDLTPDMRESIILAFPTSPLCAADCRGLCVRCGTNLNKSTCRCVQSPAGGKWNVLNDLQLG